MPKVRVNPGMVFERHEKKYRLSEAQYLALRARMEAFMRPDQYGRHTICSMYFDTPDFLIEAQVQGETPPARLRHPLA